MKVEILNKAEVINVGQEQKLVFNLFTKEEGGVYEMLCPKKSSHSPEKVLEVLMPERVLDLVRMVSIDNRFYKYEIWEAESYEVKDPIILGVEQGVHNNEPASWNDKRYFLARWGEELGSFSELKQMAIEKLSERMTLSALKIESEVQTFLKNPKLFCKQRIEKGDLHYYKDIQYI